MNTHPLAESLTAAVVSQDLDRLGDLLDPAVHLRALLPGGAVEGHGRADVLSCFRSWFGGWSRIEPVDVAGDVVGGRVITHYKLLLDRQTVPHEVTQTLLCGVRDGLVVRMDLLCSGFWEVR